MDKNNGIYVRNMSTDNGALKSVSFDAPRGMVTGLIGENGAGKSTVMRTLAGIIPYRGIAAINGADVSKSSKDRRQRIGYVGGERSLPDSLTLRMLGRVLERTFDEWDQGTFVKLTDGFFLPDNKPIGEFSTGMKAKAAIAAALSHGADTLLLDEPTSGLDIAVRSDVLGLIYDFMQDESHTVLITSHITSDLEKLCDRIALIADGRIILEADKDELLERYVAVRGDVPGVKRVKVLKRIYGEDVLAEREGLPDGADAERVTLDELLMFFIKGEDAK